MAQYSCVNDTLKCFQWLDSYRKLTDPTKINHLKMHLGFLKTFLVSAEMLSAEETNSLKDLICYVQDWVQDAGKTIRSLCANAVEESKVAEECEGKIEDLISKIKTSYRYVLLLDAAVSNSCLLVLIESVLNNLNDLLSYTRPADSTDKQIKAVEEKFRFLQNFVWFSSQRCIEHQKLQYLLSLIKAVVTNAACLSFQCLLEDQDIVLIQAKFPQVLLLIQLMEPELRYAYIRGLKSSRLESGSDPLTIEVAMGFLRCFLNDLKELLSDKSCLKTSAKDHVRSLHEELKFLIVFLMDLPETDNELNQILLARLEAVARETAPVVHLLLVSSKNEDAATTEVDPYPLYELLNKIYLIKEEMKEAYLDISMSIRSNIPRVNALGLIDFLLGTIDLAARNYKTDSIASARHQLEIVQAELFCLRSLPYNQKELEVEMAMLHEAKHAIGSLVIRESPLWHCMLQFSNVITKIRTLNNKVAALCVRDQIGDIGVFGSTASEKSIGIG